MRHVDVAVADYAVQRQQQRPVRELDSMSSRLQQFLPTCGREPPRTDTLRSGQPLPRKKSSKFAGLVASP